MDPNFAHEFLPNRAGKCKQIFRSGHCGLLEDAPVHVRFEERRTAELQALRHEHQIKRIGYVSRLSHRLRPELLMRMTPFGHVSSQIVEEALLAAINKLDEDEAQDEMSGGRFGGGDYL